MGFFASKLFFFLCLGFFLSICPIFLFFRVFFRKMGEIALNHFI